jgi:hypothetical protein
MSDPGCDHLVRWMGLRGALTAASSEPWSPRIPCPPRSLFCSSELVAFSMPLSHCFVQQKKNSLRQQPRVYRQIGVEGSCQERGMPSSQRLVCCSSLGPVMLSLHIYSQLECGRRERGIGACHGAIQVLGSSDEFHSSGGSCIHPQPRIPFDCPAPSQTSL